MNKTKTTMLCLASITGLMFNAASAVAATSGTHYPMGTEGSLAGAPPPPGIHYRMYNQWYNADSLKNDNGDDTGLDADLSVYAQVHRIVQITDKKIFGANWGYNVLIPMVSKDISINPIGIDASTSFALGDMVLEPFALFWYHEKFDAALGFALIVPSGDFDQHDAASPGLGYWSGMMTAGGTYYLDSHKSWSITTLTRTLVHSKQDDTDVRPGAEFAIEGGIAKRFLVDNQWLVLPGISYCASWQITDDSQDGHGTIASERKQGYGVGADINLIYLPWKVQTTLRYVHEFGAKNTMEGSLVSFNLTKSF